MTREIVITGLGAVTGFGVGAAALWDGLLAGQSTLGPITRFDASGFPSALASEIPDFSARKFVPKTYRKAVKVMARDIELAVGASLDAVHDAGLITKGTRDDDSTPLTYDPARVGCHIGAGLIACEIDELTAALSTSRNDAGEFDYEAWGRGAINNLTPLWLLKYLPNMLACHVTIIHDARGPSNTITCAEASGGLSIGESKRIIERGEADICFSGGAESKLNPMGMMRLEFAGRLARTEGITDGASLISPYDPDAPGSLLGEAGGIILLESKDTAAARNAGAYCQLAGAGAGQSPASDDPARRSVGLQNAIRAAIRSAGITPDQIQAILPHAAGVPDLDLEEAAALRAIFGDSLEKIPLVTLTPAIGETLAGAFGVAACVGALCVHHQTLPTRLHAGKCPSDLQAHAADQRDASIQHMLVCSSSLGGQNAAVILKRIDA